MTAPITHRARVGAAAGSALDPPQQRVDPGDQLAAAERLGEVVVGADGQPDDEVGLRIARGQHQHRNRPVPLDLAAHVEAVDPRQHEVEHDEVGLEGPAPLDPGRPVGGDGHRKSLAP